MSSDVAVIFAELIAERGGRPAFNAVGFAAARALAKILAASEPPPRAAIAALINLMPPCRPSAEELWDLTKLTDRELEHLEYLARRACGQEPARPPREKRSPREIGAVELARMIDSVAAQNRKPTEDEQRNIRGSILRLMWPAATPSDLWPDTQSIPALTDPCLEPVQEPGSEAPIEQTPRAKNIVQMVRSVHDGAPLARHEAWRD
jgi:hypothetical protein